MRVQVLNWNPHFLLERSNRMRIHVKLKDAGHSISFRVRAASLLTALGLGFLPGQTVQAATVLYAKPSGMISGVCDSWAHACDLQYILSADISGVEIWAKAGTYKPTAGGDRSLSFPLSSGIAAYGGFAGTETARNQRNPATNVTILSGDIGGAGNNDNSYHVVVAASDVNGTAILDGFTITAGNANGSYDYSGGGMDNYGSPTLMNLIFSSNTATYGGGMENNGNPTLSNVTFGNNHATGDGGGMDQSSGSATLTGVTFNNNSAIYDGGGISSTYSSGLTLTDVVFNNNHASGSGGGIYSRHSSSSTMTNVTFTGNTAGADGGGIDTDDNFDLTNATFTGNTADGDAGGIYGGPNTYAHLTNVSFDGNTSGGYGGGIYNNGGGFELSNVTFNNNDADEGGGMYSYGTQSLTVVTFSNNSATYGGGLSSQNDVNLTDVSFISNTAQEGGGFYYYGYKGTYGHTDLNNVTFSNNSATTDGGGMYVRLGLSSFSLTNTTFRGNSANQGGGLYNGSPTSKWSGTHIIIKDSILWGNTASTGAQVYNYSITSTINDSDIQGGCPAGSTCSYVVNLNPLLGNLGDYGGGTQVFPLLPGSPVIDAGDDSTCTFSDQRGISRSQGAHCDMGAFESRGFTLTITGGNGQIARINNAFAAPLKLNVTSAYGEPVNEGVITFTAPSSGASAVLSGTSATIAGGQASVTAHANGVVGAYNVTANAAGVAAPAVFHLINSLTTPSYIYLPLVIK
jgi:predicted outer membrane repeat protein